MNERLVTTKKELLVDVDSSWKSVDGLLKRLSEFQMTSIRDKQGWTVKDHIAHVTAWERSAVSFLESEARHIGLGVDEYVYLRGSEDEINAVVRRQEEAIPLDQVLARFQQVHERLIELLEPLDDVDLQQPYRHYLPEEPGDGGDRPAINVVYGNSAHHFREHLGWIEALVDENA